MDENKLFLASKKRNLNEALLDSEIYKDSSCCILEKTKELMTQYGIEPTTGILTEAETGNDEYTIIERYSNQFSKLEVPMNLYTILLNKNMEKGKLLISNIKKLEVNRINNLYEYLKQQDNFELIQNDSYDKSWYNIPTDNGDILQQSFLRISNYEEKKEQQKQILTLLKLFPKQAYIIKSLTKLMKKMDKTDFELFISNLYDERNQSINYKHIKEEKENNSLIVKTKKLLKKHA